MTTPSSRRQRFCQLAVATALGACLPTGTTLEGTMFADTARIVLVPAFADLQAAATSLDTAITSLRDAPTAGALAAAQAAWRQVRARWKAAEPLLIGPLTEAGYATSVDYWPASPTRIQEAIASGATGFDVARLGSNQKGLAALEILLFDSAQGDGAVLAALTTSESAMSRRRFASALSTDLVDKTRILNAHVAGPDGVAAELARSGRGSAVFPTQQGTLSLLHSQIVFVLETLAEKWLGGPLGKRSDGRVQPALEGAFLSDNSLADLSNTLEGLKALFFCRRAGLEGVAYFSVIVARDRALADRVAVSLERTAAAVRAIPPPLRLALIQSTAVVETAFSEALALYRLVATEVTAALGGTLLFTANDGD